MFHSLACHLTTSPDHSSIFCPEDNQFSITSAYIWALTHMCGYLCACIITFVCVAFMFACGQHHFTFIEMSSSPWGACAELRPAAMLASIDSPGLGLGWGSLSPVAPARWPAPRQSSGGENRVSSPGHRLGALPLPVETWKCEMILCVFVRAREHRNSPIKQAQVCSGKTPIRKMCHMRPIHFSAWHYTTYSKHKIFVLYECSFFSVQSSLIILQCVDCD